MPRASRVKVRTDVQAELQDNFAFLISSLTSARDIRQFFYTFLTDEEKTMLTKRLMLYLMLENKYEPAQIASVLGISRETVYKHKIVWLHGEETYTNIIRKIAKHVKTKAFWKTIEKHLRPLELFFEARTNMKARVKLMPGGLLDEDE